MRRIFAIASALTLVCTVVAVTGCTTGGRIPEPTNVPTETTETSVYFATGRTLTEERYIVDATRVHEATLAKWLEAMPVENADIAIVQPEAKVLSFKIDKDKVATIDWSKDVLDFEATDREKQIALAGLLRTMGEFPEIEKIRFTVEGKTSGTIGGKDIESFWGSVSLKGQPWEVFRRPAKPGASGTATASGEATGNE